MDIKRPSLKQAARAATAGLAMACLVSALAGCNKAADAPPAAVAPAPAAMSAPVAVAPVAPAPVAVAPAPERAPVEHHHKKEHHETQMASTPSYAPPPPPPHVCSNCGTVEAVNVVVDEGSASGAGAVGGAVAGGVLGHQMGKGRGKDAMTVLGALGGALAGNMAEKQIRKTQHYDVVVQLENGSTQTFKFTAQPPYGVGDHVKVEGDGLVAN